MMSFIMCIEHRDKQRAGNMPKDVTFGGTWGKSKGSAREC